MEFKKAAVACWCCEDQTGECQCQKEDMEVCIGCSRCQTHCACVQAQEYVEIPKEEVA